MSRNGIEHILIDFGKMGKIVEVKVGDRYIVTGKVYENCGEYRVVGKNMTVSFTGISVVSVVFMQRGVPHITLKSRNVL